MKESKLIASRLRRALEDGAEDELPDLISAEATRLAQAERGPIAAVEATLEIGLPELAPLAAEVHAAACEEKLTEDLAAELAERSPILFDRGTLHAAPVGDLGERGRERFAERLLAATLRRGPERVVLWLQSLVPHGDSDRIWRELERDLAEQGVELRRG
ncbi:MAG: hypothetical protein R6V85_14940 [Polyangia bacterium]